MVRGGGRCFHGKRNGRQPLVLGAARGLLLKVRGFLRRSTPTRVVVLVAANDDVVVVVVVTDLGLRGERGGGAQVPLLSLSGGSGGGGAAGLALGVEGDPLLLRWLGGGGGLLGRLRAWGGGGVGVGQHGRAPPLPLVGGVAGVHIALTAAFGPAAQHGNRRPLTWSQPCLWTMSRVCFLTAPGSFLTNQGISFLIAFENPCCSSITSVYNKTF